MSLEEHHLSDLHGPMVSFKFLPSVKARIKFN
jgi:hypothetical protein